MAATDEISKHSYQENNRKAWKNIIDDVLGTARIARTDEIEDLIVKLVARIGNDGDQGPKPSSVTFKAKELAWESLLANSGLGESLRETDKRFLIDSLATSWESPTNVNVESKMVIHLYDREQRNGNWSEVNINQWPKYYELINKQINYHEVILQDIKTNELYLQTSTHTASSEHHYSVELNILPIDKSELAKLGISDTTALLQTPLSLRPLSRYIDHDNESFGETMVIKAGDFYFRKGLNTSYDQQETEEEGQYNSVLKSKSSISFKQVSPERAFGLITDIEFRPTILTRNNVYEFLQENFNAELVNNFKKQEINKLLTDNYNALSGGFEENGKIVYLYQEKNTKNLLEGRKDPISEEYTFIDGVSVKRAEYIKENSNSVKESTKSLMEKVIDTLGLKSRHALRKEKVESEKIKIKMGR